MLYSFPSLEGRFARSGDRIEKSLKTLACYHLEMRLSILIPAMAHIWK
jgi:hypothetical protein